MDDSGCALPDIGRRPTTVRMALATGPVSSAIVRADFENPTLSERGLRVDPEPMLPRSLSFLRRALAASRDLGIPDTSAFPAPEFEQTTPRSP